jgi:hypothetical protein
MFVVLEILKFSPFGISSIKIPGTQNSWHIKNHKISNNIGVSTCLLLSFSFSTSPPYFLEWNLAELTNKNPPTQAPELGEVEKLLSFSNSQNKTLARRVSSKMIYLSQLRFFKYDSKACESNLALTAVLQKAQRHEPSSA